MKNCNNCALLKNFKVCPIFNKDMTNGPGCPHFTIHIETCDICGGVILENGVIDLEDDKLHISCPRCASLPHCKVCINTQKCAFRDDESCKIPPTIMKVVSPKPGIRVQQQAINPERVQATCGKGCPCFYEEGLSDGRFCLKELGGSCHAYKTDWQK